MKYFTPELYLRFNSQSRRVVEKAHDEWETAIESYQKHLRSIGSGFTDSTRRLAESLCLHDAEYLGLTLPAIPKTDHSLGVVMVRQDEALVLLIYMLAEEPLMQEVPLPWPFAKDRPYWLYDEFDIDAAGVQRHDVLLSNGRVLTLKFHEMQMIAYDVHKEAAVA